MNVLKNTSALLCIDKVQYKLQLVPSGMPSGNQRGELLRETNLEQQVHFPMWDMQSAVKVQVVYFG